MKSMKFKQAYRRGGNLSPQNPCVPPGDNGSVITWAVVGIPDDVSMPSVFSVFASCVTLVAEKKGRYVYEWDELRRGAVLR